MSNPIWKSAELECWSRDFDYYDYKQWCAINANGIPPVSEYFYGLLCGVFQASMERDLRVARGEE